MGKYMQHQFDTIVYNDIVYVDIEADKIRITKRDPQKTQTDIYIYNQYYGFWSWRETQCMLDDIYIGEVYTFFGQ
jgi:hypothetical protein